MDFRFSEEQEALRASVRDALSGWLPREQLFAAIDDGASLPAGRWQEMADLGWTGLLVPEEHGGAGCGLVDMTVVCEEMGRLPLPGPFFSSAVLAVLAARALGATDLLPSLADGTKVGTVAVDEAGTHGDPLDAIATRATASGDGYVLDGAKPTVLDGARADFVIVVARDDAGLAGFLVEGAAGEVVPGLDPTRELARLSLNATPAKRLGPAGDQTELWRRFIDDAGILLCAELVGACDAAFEAAGEYAKVRVQFGRPIGTFQAIKHIAAEMLQSLTLARVGAHYAAWCSDTEAPDREQAAAMAKSWVAEAAIHVTGDTIQIHGGVGFTWEAGAHLWFKRAKANDLMLGRQGWNRSRVADLILGPADAIA